MRSNRLLLAFVTCLSLTGLLRADCANNRDHRSSKNSGFLITEVIITGTQTLTSAELAMLASKLDGSCFDENPAELEEHVQTLFKNRGYATAVVKSLRIKPDAPLALPKPVTLEAEVLEGPRYRLAEIKFTGNHAFDEEKLRSGFPLRKGDHFERDKIASGIMAVLDFYSADGFLDFTATSDAQSLSDATMILTLSITEGPQYRMGKLEVFARKEISDRLQAEWQMPEGSVFDFTYIDKYISANRSLLPTEFTRKNVQLVRNCPEASVAVRLPLDGTDPLSQSHPKDVACEPAGNAARF